MKTSEDFVELLFEKIKAYGKITYELTKLKLLKKTTKILPSLLARLIFVLIIFMFALILSIGISILIGESLGRLYYGFFIVAAFYLVCGFVSYFFLHKWIKKPVGNFIINLMLH